jgi:hypothetical protein
VISAIESKKSSVERPAFFCIAQRDRPALDAAAQPSAYLAVLFASALTLQ